jgi:hypothetical protein
MKKSFLRDFINKKLREYKAPSREGTPKGEPIGFFENKYQASLEMLTYATQSTMAERVGVTHGLFRKWTSEDDFKEKVEGHCREFTEKYIEIVLDKGGLRKQLQDYLGKSSNETYRNADHLPNIFEVHRRGDNYGFRLRNVMIQHFLKALLDCHDIIEKIAVLSALVSLVTPEKIKLRIDLQRNVETIKMKVRHHCTKEVRERILKPEITKEDKDVIFCMVAILDEA